MRTEETRKLQNKVLKRAKEECEEDKIPAVLRTLDGENPSAVLEVMMGGLGQNQTEVLGEFMFTGTDREGTIQNFCGIYNLTDEIHPDRAADLGEAISLLNFYLPHGCFGLYPASGLMVYKLSAPLITDLSEEQLYEQIQLLMTNGFFTLEPFLDILLGIAAGEDDVAVLYEMLGAEREE